MDMAAKENSVDNVDVEKLKKTCVVLGGRGFVGRALVKRLLKLGNWIVRVVDSAQSPELDPSESLLSDALSTGSASYFHVDVRNKPQIVEAIEGASVVFYSDSVDSLSHDFYFCHTTIVQGAKNVVNACRECKVKRLIYNSSADVVFDITRDIYDGDESLPYSDQFESMLTDLKSQAEALVLLSNDIDGLLTCSLRGCNIFGPGDKQLIPLLLNMANSNFAKLIIGSGEKLSDFTYVDNVAHAHICAEESLSSRMVSVSGKAFFITNLEPMKFWGFVLLVLESLGYQRPMIKLPAWLADKIILLMKLLRLKLNSRKFDQFVSVYNVAKLGSRTRTFSCAAAKELFGYSPVVSMEEGLALTIDSFSHLARESAFKRYRDSYEHSKVEKLLGSGRVADILLWRNEKKTFSCFLLMVLLHYWFFLSGRTFISSAAKLLLLVIALLSGYQMLPSNIFHRHGFIIHRISSSLFEVSEVDMRISFLSIAHSWNWFSNIARILARGEDWHTFLKVSGFLYLCRLVIPQFLTMAIGIGLVLSFIVFFVYEQYDEDIDGMASLLSGSVRKVIILVLRNMPKPLTSVVPNYEPLEERSSL